MASISEYLTGSQIGSRQLELPPNMSEFARDVLDDQLADARNRAEVAVAGVDAADAADRVGRAKLLLVEHPGEDPRQHGGIDGREQPRSFSQVGSAVTVWP